MRIDQRIGSIPWRLRGLAPAAAALLFTIAYVRGALPSDAQTDARIGLFWALLLSAGLSVAWQLVDSTKPSNVRAVWLFCFVAWAGSVTYLFADPLRFEVLLGSMFALATFVLASSPPAASEAPAPDGAV